MGVARRLATPLLVAGVAAVGVLAAVDALRGDDGARRAATTAAPPAGRSLDDAAADLAAADVAGTLVVADDRCFVTEVRLPSLDRSETRPRPGCEFTLSPGARVGVDGEAVSPDGRLRARCDGDVVEVTGRDQRDVRATYFGCNPAWRADGRVVVVRRGEVRLAGVCPGGTAPGSCSTAVLTRRDLARGLARAGQARASFSVGEAAWLDRQTLAVVVSARDATGGYDLLALFRDRRLVGLPLGPFARLGRLRASPSGRFVAAISGLPGTEVVVADRDGNLVRRAPSAHAIAWSPDERWVALARGGAVAISDRVDTRAQTTIRVPLAVRDLAWR